MGQFGGTAHTECLVLEGFICQLANFNVDISETQPPQCRIYPSHFLGVSMKVLCSTVILHYYLHGV